MIKCLGAAVAEGATGSPMLMTSRKLIYIKFHSANKINTIKFDRRSCQTNAIGKIRHSFIHYLIIGHVVVIYSLQCFDLLKTSNSRVLPHHVCGVIYKDQVVFNPLET